ncbi:MAG: hypothetical protein AB7D06_12110 [Pedobacter sp.]
MISGCQQNTSFRPGMVVALPSEAKAMLGRRRWLMHGDLAQCTCGGPEDVKILWVRCGMGPEKAARAAALLIEQGVTHLGIAGVSGGLDPDLGSGQLVLASEVVDEDGKSWPVDPSFQRTLTACFGREIRSGSILTTAEPLLNVAQKKLWFERTKALAVDMESAAVAQMASAAGLPFFALRAICDEATRSVPAALFDLVDDLGRPRLLKLIGSLLMQPSLLPVLIRMQGDFSRALRALRYGWQVCCRLKPGHFDEGEEQV